MSASVLRVSAASTNLARVASFEAFAEGVRQHARCAHDAGSALLVFPEYLTSPLLSLDPCWEVWTEPYETLLHEVSRSHGLVILGTHLHRDHGGLFNRAQLFVPDGRSLCQDKIHLTPWERQAGYSAGSGLVLADVLGTRVAILICYDVEFPALAGAAASAGAEVLLVPSWTDDRHGYFRVRYCAHARTVEHQVYVVHAPLVGGDASIPDFESAVGRAGILAPCDGGGPQAGILAEGSWDAPQVVSAQLDLARLRQLHANGTVTPRRDARPQAACAVRQIVALD